MGETERTSFIRAHPFISTWVVLTVVPLLVGAALLVVRYAPPCSEWRRQVRASANAQMGSLYMGGGSRQAVDAGYRSEDGGYKQAMDRLMKAAEYEHAGSRPFACI